MQSNSELVIRNAEWTPSKRNGTAIAVEGALKHSAFNIQLHMGMSCTASPFFKGSDFMRFSFNVKLTDEDYYLFNEFTVKHMPVGKKTALLSKIIVAVIFLYGAINIFLTKGINSVSVTAAAFFVILFIILALAFDKINSKIVRLQVRTLLKKDKKPYTADSDLEFYDEFFKEIAPDNKSELRYTAIDKITVIKNRYIFIFLDGIRGFVIPVSCFENEEQQKAFLSFLGTVCSKTEYFDKI